MMRHTLIALAVCSATPATALADDYVVRVESVGYVDKPVTDKSPQDTVLRAIEVITASDSRFYGKVTIGDKTLVLSGELKSAKMGKFDLEVHVRYLQSVNAGTIVPDQDGKTKKFIVLHALKTGAVLDLDKPVIIGRNSSKTTNGKNNHRIQTKIRHILVLSKNKPSDE